MTDPDKTEHEITVPISTPGGSGPGLRRVALLASAGAAAIVAMLLGAIVAFQSSDNVLSPSEVAQRLADASAAPDDSASPDDSAAPSAQASASSAPGSVTGTPAVLDTVAATITLSCDGTRLVQATWSIKPGYRLDERSQTSARLRLWIESDVHEDVTVIAVCPGSVQVTAEPDDHGGGDGGGGNSGPGGGGDGGGGHG